MHTGEPHPTWKDFPPDLNDEVNRRSALGHNIVQYTWADANGPTNMEIDLTQMTQINTKTGTVRRIRLIRILHEC